jgi:NADH:ubiquinone oxidoreductase subunit E
MNLLSGVPGWGIFKGMVGVGLRQFFSRKVTIQYPEVVQDISPKHRGRLLLLYDEYGTIKCETCFQCAQACPIECIDMGGVDTKNRFHVHWGPAEQYDERREESAVRRAGRVVQDPAFLPFAPIDLGALEPILAAEDYDPKRMLPILEQTQATYGFLPVAALKHISHSTGAWYAEVYGIATSYDHLRLDPPTTHEIGVCRCPACSMRGGGRVLAALEVALGTELGGTSPEGAVRLVAVDCQGESAGMPFVTVDGKREERIDADRARQIAERLRAAAVPVGRA